MCLTSRGKERPAAFRSILRRRQKYWEVQSDTVKYVDQHQKENVAVLENKGPEESPSWPPHQMGGLNGRKRRGGGGGWFGGGGGVAVGGGGLGVWGWGWVCWGGGRRLFESPRKPKQRSITAERSNTEVVIRGNEGFNTCGWGGSRTGLFGKAGGGNHVRLVKEGAALC